MKETKSLEVFAKASVRKAVLQNALPAMLMVLIYNLADTFFIGQTHDDLQVAAVSLATPVFLLFMSVGTVFGIGGTLVISRALGEGRKDYAKKVCSFCMWSCVGVGVAMKVTMMTGMVCTGLGQGIQPLLGYCVGARNWERYRSALRFSLQFAFALSVVLYRRISVKMNCSL